MARGNRLRHAGNPTGGDSSGICERFPAMDAEFGELPAGLAVLIFTALRDGHGVVDHFAAGGTKVNRRVAPPMVEIRTTQAPLYHDASF